MRSRGGVEGGAFAPTVADEHLVHGREAPAPDKMGGDHQRTPTDGVFGGGSKDAEAGEQAEVADGPDGQSQVRSASFHRTTQPRCGQMADKICDWPESSRKTAALGPSTFRIFPQPGARLA